MITVKFAPNANRPNNLVSFGWYRDQFGAGNWIFLESVGQTRKNTVAFRDLQELITRHALSLGLDDGHGFASLPRRPEKVKAERVPREKSGMKGKAVNPFKGLLNLNPWA